MFPNRKGPVAAASTTGASGSNPMRGAPVALSESPLTGELLDVSQVEMFFPNLLQSIRSTTNGFDDEYSYGDDGKVLVDQREEDSDWEEEDDENESNSPSRHSRRGRAALSGQGDLDDLDHHHHHLGEDGFYNDDDDDDEGDEDEHSREHHHLFHDSEDVSEDHSLPDYQAAAGPQATGSAAAGGGHKSLTATTAPSSSSAAATSSSSSAANNLASRTRNAFLKVGGFVKREINKARKSSGVSKRQTARVLVRKKQVQELNNVRCVQRVEAHSGAVWCLEFSHANLLATGGADGKVLVWAAMTEQHDLGGEEEETTAVESLLQQDDCVAGVQVLPRPLLHSKPLRTLMGHVGDVLSLSWSRSHFLASSSVDKTVRVWFPTTIDTCLCVMKHPDFVTGVDFHPINDSLLLTGCFDKQVRLWDVTTGACLQRVQTPTFITACKLNLTGDFAVVGLYTGHCVFYQLTPTFGGKSMGMRYFTQIECRNKTGLQKKGRKVTRIRFVNLGVQEHMLVTTNESRCRLYTMDDFSLKCKYRGSLNPMLQIGASCSEDGRHIICGGEDRHMVIWRTKNDLVKYIFGRQGKKLLCDTHESFRAVDSGPVTVAQFAPDRLLLARRGGAKPEVSVQSQVNDEHEVLHAEDMVGLRGAVVITAGFDGVVGIFESN
ncbi:hypothetical protein BASA81_006139 [Batrachochytrium salamandrivorans]|nr:hypothetical protein BASA81_006139 [Batrachochytrium salamandrivorans]